MKKRNPKVKSDLDLNPDLNPDQKMKKKKRDQESIKNITKSIRKIIRRAKRVKRVVERDTIQMNQIERREAVVEAILEVEVEVLLES